MPIAEASIPITDWGFLRSDATYDVVTVWEGAFFRLDAHLERFARSCQSFRAMLIKVHRCRFSNVIRR